MLRHVQIHLTVYIIFGMLWRRYHLGGSLCTVNIFPTLLFIIRTFRYQTFTH